MGVRQTLDRCVGLKRLGGCLDGGAGFRGEGGQMLVESALALICFFLLLFGIFGFAFVFFGYCNITYAALAADRSASVSSNTSLVPATTASITSQATPFLVGVPAGSSTITVTYGSSNPTSTPPSGGSALNTIGGTVTVLVTATYQVTMPFTSYRSFTVSSSSQRTITR